MIRSRLAGLSTLLLLSACSGDRGTRGAPAVSERARDSVIGASHLPGAQGVRGALRVSDSAAARRAREDSVGQTPQGE
ncbi:MAG: hypothetical protein ABI766_06390 [Gemmatimonadales bacterium]